MQESWTVQKILNTTIDFFQKNKVPDARLSAELLLAAALNCRRIDLYLQFERILTPGEVSRYRSFVQRRVKYEPVQYITGKQDFMGLTFEVTPAVLIPRPETELLVEQILADLNGFPGTPPRILDVGTGSGAIAITIAHFFPACHVTAIDNSEAALEIAKRNSQKIGVDKIEFRVQNALNIKPDEWQKFDIIVSNPPYIGDKEREDVHPQVKDYEPPEALFSGPEGLNFIVAFIPVAVSLLTEDGTLYMEIGFNQREKIYMLLKQQQFSNIQFIEDYRKIDRIVKAKK